MFFLKIFKRITIREYILFSLFFLFASALMWKTFRISPDGNLQIAAKAWSDFAATLPLIRSFSMGSNFPPEYPIFAGPPIKYHFLFFAAVGTLERIGLPLDWVFNGLSIIFFFALLLVIYFLGKSVFGSYAVGVLSVLLFLFNGSFGFLEFFKLHPLPQTTFKDVFDNANFSSFGPYDGRIVSAFWNLNIYTNQRHLALAYASFLTLLTYIYLVSDNPKRLSVKKSILIGGVLGIFPFIHLSVFLMSGISLLIFLVVYPKIRKQIFLIGAIALVLAIPQFLYMGKSQIVTAFYHPGYLVSVLTTRGFLGYWFMNFGLTCILAPIGFLMSSKNQKKILIPFIVFFVIGNLFQFTPDMPTNHKFFNMTVIGLNFFTSYLLIKLWKSKIIFKTLVPMLLLTLTLTGLIDIFPIFNDHLITLDDIPNNKTAKFIKDNTPKDAVFLNSNFLYDPASLAGRKIYMGWPYFSWGAGYDTSKRDLIMKEMFMSSDVERACNLFLIEKIDYIEIQEPNNLIDTPVNYLFFEENFKKIYYNPETKLSIYDIIPTCSNFNNDLKR